MDLVAVLEEQIKISEVEEGDEDSKEEEINIRDSIPIGWIAIPDNRINQVLKESIMVKVSGVASNLAFKEEVTQEISEINKKNHKFVHSWASQAVASKVLMHVVIVMHNRELVKRIMVG